MPGGGCRGDIHDGTAQPSATQTIGSRQWEYFEFTCSISGARPVNYGGQAWETHLSDAVVAIVFIQSPDAAFDSTILKQARDTLELR